MKKLFAYAIILAAALSLPVGAQSAQSLNVGASAETVCIDKKVRIDWTFTNLEDKPITLLVKDNQHGQTSTSINVEPDEVLTSSFKTTAKSSQSGQLEFTITPSGQEKKQQIQADYSGITCAEEVTPADTEEPAAPADQPEVLAQESSLPNTGPLDGLMFYLALVLASGSAWLVTRQELNQTLKN